MLNKGTLETWLTKEMENIIFYYCAGLSRKVRLFMITAMLIAL